MRYVLPYARIGASLGLPGGEALEPITRAWDDIVQVIRFLIYPTPVLDSWYLQQYPDVGQALSSGGYFQSPTHHFLTAGYFEGRLPSPPGSDYARPASFTGLKSHFVLVPTRSALTVQFKPSDLTAMIRDAIACVPVDEAAYLAAYQDVNAAVELGQCESAKEHYVESGYFEHRHPYDFGLDGDYYVQVYRDIADVVAVDPSFDAKNHFHFIGYQEGRWPRSDALVWLTEA